MLTAQLIAVGIVFGIIGLVQLIITVTDREFRR